MVSCPAPAAASALASRVARLRWLCASRSSAGFRNINRVEYAARQRFSSSKRKFEAGDVVDRRRLSKAKGIIKKLDHPRQGSRLVATSPRPLTIKVDKISASCCRQDRGGRRKGRAALANDSSLMHSRCRSFARRFCSPWASWRCTASARTCRCLASPLTSSQTLSPRAA